MPRDYLPCLPTRVDTAPKGRRWIHEVKHDGFRLVARKVAGRVHLFTKEGHDWSDRYPMVANALLSCA